MASCSTVTNFQKEISDMMHGFGDHPNPEPGTVLLVESIVREQLCSVLREACVIAGKRRSTKITNYELIFLMRRNIPKLKQLHDYQLTLDRLDGGITISNEEDFVSDIQNKKQKVKRNHIEIIEDLDEMDEVKHVKGDPLQERRMRAVKLAESSTLEQYEHFHKARCSSFRSNSGNLYGKLEKWVNPQKELKITLLAMEVLNFIAYETVAELVDSILKVRMDASKKPGDPFSKLDGGMYSNPGATPNADYMKTGFEGCCAITESEVREVIRRYYMPGGMNGMFSRNMSQSIPVRFIAF